MLEPKLIHLPDQAVLCATERGMVDNHMSAAAQKAFGRLQAGVKALGLLGRIEGVLGISPDAPKGPNDPDMRFVAAFLISGTPPDLSTQPGLHWDSIAAGRWAVFRHLGPYETLSNTWRAVHGEWAPGSGLTRREAAPYEHYLNDPSDVPPQELITDIHIAVA